MTIQVGAPPPPRRLRLPQFLLLLLSLALLGCCQGFSSPFSWCSSSSSSCCSSRLLLHSSFSSSRLYSSTGRGPGAGAGAGRGGDAPPNLYAILGASPKDSDAEIKRKWQLLARKLHPDANIQNLNDLDKEGQLQQGQQSGREIYPYDLSDVNAAWGVLSDPKERRRYDRSLQAQEFADTFEILLDAGIKTAIPFLQKTATASIKFGEQSASTLKEVGNASNQALNDYNRRLKVNSQIKDLDNQSKEYDKKAINARSRMQRLQNQLDSQGSRQLESLQNPNTPLSSQEAIRLLNKFDRVTDPSSDTKQQQGLKQKGGRNSNSSNSNNKRSFLVGSTSDKADREIEYLEDLEFQYRDVKKYLQSRIQFLKNAQKQADDAIIAEQKAYARLEQAQQDLMDAQSYNHDCQQEQFDAVQTEKEAQLEYDSCLSSLNQQIDKVKYVLRQKESESFQQEALVIQEKLQQLLEDENQFQQQSAEFKTQANSLRQQQQQEKRGGKEQ